MKIQIPVDHVMAQQFHDWIVKIGHECEIVCNQLTVDGISCVSNSGNVYSKEFFVIHGMRNLFRDYIGRDLYDKNATIMVTE